MITDNGKEGESAKSATPAATKEAKTAPSMVTLKAKDAKDKKKEFPIAQANQLLKTPKSQWELSDSKFEWNGTEIAKK